VGAVTERLDISLEEAKAYFRVDSDVEDEVIMGCLAAAKAEADAYLQNPFVDADGEALPIPPALKMWVLRRAHHHYVQRIGGVANESVSGIGSVSYRDDAFAELKPYRKKVVRFV
jgi:hypothetical protein